MDIKTAINVLRSGACDRIQSAEANWYMEREHIDTELMDKEQFLKLYAAKDWKMYEKVETFKEIPLPTPGIKYPEYICGIIIFP